MNSINYANNVTRLNQNTVFDHIQIFLRNKAKSSKNTAIKYEKDIRDFFMYLRNKNIEDLTTDDLKVINAEVLDYQSYLSDRFKNSTVNSKLVAVKSLYKFFQKNNYDVNPHALDVDDLPDDSTRIGFLSPDEVFLLAELALKYETHNRYMKYALILLAFATSMRQNALLQLEYKHIRQCDKDPNKYIIEPDFLDKGKKIYKEIHADLYQILLQAKEKDVRKRTDDKLFTIDAKGISQMMQRLCKIAGFDPRRNISFHSIRKAGADFAYEFTGGDMTAVTAQGSWSSPDVPYKYYLKPQTNITGIAAFEKIDDDVFDQLTHEELLMLVKKQGNGFGQKLRREAQNIINNRKNN